MTNATLSGVGGFSDSSRVAGTHEDEDPNDAGTTNGGYAALGRYETKYFTVGSAEKTKEINRLEETLEDGEPFVQR
jgi:hypothetical protein